MFYLKLQPYGAIEIRLLLLLLTLFTVTSTNVMPVCCVYFPRQRQAKPPPSPAVRCAQKITGRQAIIERTRERTKQNSRRSMERQLRRTDPLSVASPTRNSSCGARRSRAMWTIDAKTTSTRTTTRPAKMSKTFRQLHDDDDRALLESATTARGWSGFRPARPPAHSRRSAPLCPGPPGRSGRATG